MNFKAMAVGAFRRSATRAYSINSSPSSLSTGPIETLETYDGATVEVEELESVDITSVRDPQRPEYAEPGSGQ